MFEMLIRLLTVVLLAVIAGKVAAKFKMPAVLGFLIAGMLLGPYAVNLLTQDILDNSMYHTLIELMECGMGLMLGSEMIWRKMRSSGKQIVVITLAQSLMTFAVVSLAFSAIFYFMDIPVFLGLIFGGIALATAPAPALSIVSEYKTDGPVTRTLIPLAVIDDVLAICVFLLVMSFILPITSGGSVPKYLIILIVIFPVLIGLITGGITAFIMKKIRSEKVCAITVFAGVLVTAAMTALANHYLMPVPVLNFMLSGMVYSATFANILDEKKLEDIMKYSTNGELPKRVTDVKQQYILISNDLDDVFKNVEMDSETAALMKTYMDTMTNPEKRDELFTKLEKVFDLIEFNLPLKKEGQATYTMKVNSDEFIDRAVHSLDKTVMNLDQILKIMEWKEIIPEGDSVAEFQKEYADGMKEEIMQSVPEAKKLLKGSYLNTKETFSEDKYKGEIEANICVNEPLYLKVNMKIDTESKKVAKKEVKVPTRAEAITLQEYMDLYMPAVKDTIVLDTKTNVLKSEKNGTQVKLKTTKNAEGEVMYEFAPIMRSFGVEFGYDQKVHQVYYIDNGVKEYVDDVVEKNGISYISIENIDYRWVSDAMSEDDGNTYRYVIREAE